MTKKSYNQRSSTPVADPTIPAPPDNPTTHHQFTARIPLPIWEKISALAQERGISANSVLIELLSAAISEDALPKAQELLAQAMEGAEVDATAVYGNVPSELEKLSESIEKIRAQLEKLDSEIAEFSAQGEFRQLRLRIAEREELRGKVTLLEGKRRMLEERLRDRERYTAACYRHRILRNIEHLEPLIRQRLANLAEVLDVAISLLNEIPEFRRWETGLLYWLLAHLARDSADPNWQKLLQGHLPVGWNPERLKTLAELYAP